MNNFIVQEMYLIRLDIITDNVCKVRIQKIIIEMKETVEIGITIDRKH